MVLIGVWVCGARAVLPAGFGRRMMMCGSALATSGGCGPRGAARCGCEAAGGGSTRMAGCPATRATSGAPRLRRAPRRRCCSAWWRGRTGRTSSSPSARRICGTMPARSACRAGGSSPTTRGRPRPRPARGVRGDRAGAGQGRAAGRPAPLRHDHRLSHPSGRGLDRAAGRADARPVRGGRGVRGAAGLRARSRATTAATATCATASGAISTCCPTRIATSGAPRPGSWSTLPGCSRTETLLRILLEIVLPFLAPFLVFYAYRLLVTRGQGFLERTPWYALIVCGVVLACLSLVVPGLHRRLAAGRGVRAAARRGRPGRAGRRAPAGRRRWLSPCRACTPPGSPRPRAGPCSKRSPPGDGRPGSSAAACAMR